jgi:signal transduction histidine kinase
LSLQKIEAGEFSIELKPFSMVQLFSVAQKRSQLMMEKAKLTLRSVVDPQIRSLEENDKKFMLGDYHRILQVLTNLLSNASKFTPEGGAVCIEATLTSLVDTDATKISIETQDVESSAIAGMSINVYISHIAK